MSVLREDYPDASLSTPFDLLPMDSLSYIELIHELESSLDISFPPKVKDRFRSAAEILRFVESGVQ